MSHIALQPSGFQSSPSSIAVVRRSLQYSNPVHPGSLLSHQELWTAAYYRRKRQEGKSHSMAVRALANVWVRIFYAM